MKIRINIYSSIRTSVHLHICTSLLFLIFSQIVVAHSFNPPDSVGVRIIKGQKFILYKVGHGETWYGISRRFGLAAKDVQAVNEDAKSKPLSVGQTLLIPMSNATLPSSEAKTVAAVNKPIYYKVKKGETLYSIAVKSGQTMEAIMHWNSLTFDKLQGGQELIIGYENEKKETPKPLPVLVKQAPVGKIDTSKKDKSDWNKQAGKGTSIEERGVATFIEDQDINPNKYYALHRTAPKGSIIRVTNIMNKKQIYVKVIGELPDTGDNNDLIIKISKATAKKLDVLDTRFQVILNYYGE